MPTRPNTIFPTPVSSPSLSDFISYFFSSWQSKLPGTTRSQGLCLTLSLNVFPQRSAWFSPTHSLGLCTVFTFSVNEVLTSSFRITEARLVGAFSCFIFPIALIIGWHTRHFTISYFNPLDRRLHEDKDFVSRSLRHPQHLAQCL